MLIQTVNYLGACCSKLTAERNEEYVAAKAAERNEGYGKDH